MAGVWRGAFTCVGWQVTLCDPTWQVTSLQGSHEELYRLVRGTVCMQETSKLFEEMSTLSDRKLIGLLIECNFVELVKKICERDLREDKVQKMKKLPHHLDTCLHVISYTHFSYF